MIKKVMQFLDKAHSQYHATKESIKFLEAKGFIKLSLDEDFKIEKGNKYYIEKSDSSFIAFTIGKNFSKNAFQIFAAHTDSPTFKVKPNPLVFSNNTVRLNVEVYGGPIINTWYDRVLSFAGRVIVEENGKLISKIVDIDEDLLTIPNLAIHQNREVNLGVKVDKQAHTLPIFFSGDIADKDFSSFLEDKIKERLENKNIIDFDLYLYLRENAKLVGQNQNMLSSARIDNIVSLFAGLHGITHSFSDDSINVLVGFDNEEIGSQTKQGAHSNFVSNVLERIYYALDMTRSDFLRDLNKSYMLSSDAGHAVHPAYPGKSDITNHPYMNGGVIIKMSSNQRYTSEAESISILRMRTNEKLQTFVNNSNEVGGTTIGPISTSHLEVTSIDIGIPMLAMHSVRELCGVLDVLSLINLANDFYGKKQ